MAQQDYSDIIGMEHHRSERHPYMSNIDRAAQFSPFAALTGYDDCITEAARLTEAKTELDDETRERLDKKLLFMQTVIAQRPVITFTIFQRDKHKDGGEYITVSGAVRKIDSISRQIILVDGTVLSLDDVTDMESGMFPEEETL